MKTAVVYFSATGNTAIVSDVVAKVLQEQGVDVTKIQITAYKDRQRVFDTETYDSFVFGMPVHSWRAPRVVREWLLNLDGRGKRCAMFFTFGGFEINLAHYSTRELLRKSNFVVVSSAEFPAAHTYNIHGGWRAMIGRPNDSDFLVAQTFAQKTCKRLCGEDTGILGGLEQPDVEESYLDMIESFRFKVVTQLPTRNGEECSLCGECEARCPTQAIRAETGVADPERCICCMACVSHCPDDALKVNDLSTSWQHKLGMHKTTEADMLKQESRIYL
ncbi:EFR1 family ferrodoxin [Desulfobulbus rhabdoformis]|uniref:EFR1 family ferrodoxin n=1 Tax=Desulfobulbus rhabdoformis TaxID=34032 RepID=UPI0019666089|nr:EFR1 family ferrodoxin [Desulfobulbus rhabdoformis]MBM9616181.1 EFR1 family ferrodoxin [Desulfobulbus rhabdoformis]